MLTKAKSKYLADVISTLDLPEFTSVKSRCDHFSRYFVDKIETIRSKFPDKVQNILQVQKNRN